MTVTLAAALGAALDDLDDGPQPRTALEAFFRCVQVANDLPADRLGRLLAEHAPDEREDRDAFVDVLGLAARGLAPGGVAPADGPAGQAWQALLVAVERLHPSGFRVLGTLALVDDTRRRLLLAEAREQLPEPSSEGERVVGPPGEQLAALAVSRRLRAELSRAWGCALVPTYAAVYLYDPPASQVPLHVDHRRYELVLHLTLAHALPHGHEGSRLIVHRAGASAPDLVPVPPGEAVLLAGRGSIHAWEPLTVDERRTLVGIGFARSETDR